MQRLTDSIRGYDSFAAMLNAIHQLAKQGFNYFVPFRDVNAEFALQYGIADWVPAGHVHVDGGYPGYPDRKYPRCSRPWVHKP